MATITVKASGGDFDNLSQALSDAGTGAGDIISIEGSWSSDDANTATIADDNLTIQTDASSKHPGYWDEATSQHYRLVSSSGHALTLNGAYTLTIDGVAIEQAGTGVSDECFRCVPGTSDAVTIKNCIMRCTGDETQQDCLYTGYQTSIGTITIENCIFYGAYRAGIHSQNCYSSSARTGAIKINSCTMWNCGRDPSPSPQAAVGGGFNIAWGAIADHSGFTVDFHNCIAVENDTGSNYISQYPHDYNEYQQDAGTSPTINISYSMDSDNSIASLDSGGSGNLASRTATDSDSPGTGDWVVFEDITSSPYDLRIKDNAENDAQDAHSTATAEGLTIPSTDIVGTSRPQNTNYDMGAFEILAAGESASVSPSASESPSISPSASVSPSSSASPSPSPGAVGETTWGHDTGVTETNIRDFSGNWTGTGVISGSGDAEIVTLDPSEYMESEIIQLGATVQILQNSYDVSGEDAVLKYRHGATPNACAAAAWSTYSAPFESDGYVQVRIENT